MCRNRLQALFCSIKLILVPFNAAPMLIYYGYRNNRNIARNDESTLYTVLSVWAAFVVIRSMTTMY